MPILPPGSRIALFSASGPPDRERAAWGEAFLRAQGWEPLRSRPMAARHPRLPYLAGSDEERLAELEWALTTPAEAAWAVRGGYGLTRLVGRLPVERLQARAVLGFSDVTALLWKLQAAGWTDLWHAPNVQSLELQGWHAPGPLTGRPLLAGSCEGPLVGGNLCVLASLCGTPDQLRAEGAILLLEDVNEAPYRVDRYLTQLRQSGALRGLRGLALGSFTGAEGNVEPVFLDHFPDLPILADLPVGHGKENRPLRLSVSYRIAGGQLCCLDP